VLIWCLSITVSCWGCYRYCVVPIKEFIRNTTVLKYMKSKYKLHAAFASVLYKIYILPIVLCWNIKTFESPQCKTGCF
jgi:hypothetical protein